MHTLLNLSLVLRKKQSSDSHTDTHVTLSTILSKVKDKTRNACVSFIAKSFIHNLKFNILSKLSEHVDCRTITMFYLKL